MGVEHRHSGLGRLRLLPTPCVPGDAHPRSAVVVERQCDERGAVRDVDIHQVVEQSLGEMARGVEEPEAPCFGRQLEVALREFITVGRLEVANEDAATVGERDHFSVQGSVSHVPSEDTPSVGTAPQVVQCLSDVAVDTFCWPRGLLLHGGRLAASDSGNGGVTAWNPNP